MAKKGKKKDKVDEDDAAATPEVAASVAEPPAAEGPGANGETAPGEAPSAGLDNQSRAKKAKLKEAYYEEEMLKLLLEPNGNYYYIDEYLFDDDPLLTANERTRQEGRGGNGIIKLAKDSHGRWTGTRDIVLGRNIPGYP